MVYATSKNNVVPGKAAIRVIKKGESTKAEKNAVVGKQPSNERERRMVATVMNWVSDFENRKLEETRLATKRFQHMY